MPTYKALKDIKNQAVGNVKAGTIIGYIPEQFIQPLEAGGFIEVQESVKTTYQPEKTATKLEIEQAKQIEALKKEISALKKSK